MRLARVRATAYPKLTLSLRVLRPTRRRLPRPRGAGRLARSAPRRARGVRGAGARAACRSRSSATTPRPRTSPPTTATSRSSPPRSCWCAPGDRVTACALVLRKHIPAGAGLGGGSADAAAALLAVRRLLDVDIDDAGVLALAAEVGSDVSFCVRGGAAWMRGRGEIIEPVVARHRARVPRRDPAVPAVDARRVPRVGRARRPTVASARCRRRAGVGAILPELANDLEPAAEALEPRLRGVPRRARGRDRRARAARRERLGLRGAGRPTPCLPACRQVAAAAGAVVGTTSVSRRRLGWSARPASARRRADSGDAEVEVLAALLAALPARRFRSFLCFFFRMRLRRFLIREPMAARKLVARRAPVQP